MDLDRRALGPAGTGGSFAARLRATLSGLGCSPAEAVALAVLVAGAVSALGLLWLAARPGPAAPGEAAGRAEGVPAAPQLQGLPGTSDPPSTASSAAPSAPSEVVVHVAGLVAAPGVYRLPAGSRVADALTAAGGPQEGAGLEALNLARSLTDGEQVLVLAPGQAPPVVPAPPAGAGPAGSASGAPGPGGGVRPDGTIDLNLATVEELDTLPGVGPVLAGRIIEHRETIGRFGSVGELRDVTGIGEKTFQDLVDLVSVPP